MILNKPKFWDYKKPSYLSYLLLPFTVLFMLSNYFLNLKKKNKNYINIKTLCLGNIYVGGTGKTPLSIKISQILQNLGFKTATIKKYYKKQIDEQKLLNSKTKLYCSKKRVHALHEAVKDNIDIAIFDDGLQDKSINYDLKFVCFSSKNWIGNGMLIPAGPLREKLKDISKYDAIFLNGNQENTDNLKILIKRIKSDIKIFETYYEPVNMHELDNTKNYLIFSGIGNPHSFKKTLLKNNFKIVHEIDFPDHYQYKKKDIINIKSIARSLNANILTTEKDFVKIAQNDSREIKFLEISLIVKKQEELISFIKSNL